MQPSFKVKVTQNRFQEIVGKIVRSSMSDQENVVDAIVTEAQGRIHNITGETGAGIQKTKIGDRSWEVESTASHSAALEYGHIQHPGQYVAVIGARLVADWVAAKPFFYPAVETVRAQVSRFFGKVEAV